ncbi:hypothetical protein BU24DRAFT_497519 [Aaosphaeria arxii CBS 175.79]|uniref:RGS domain-containing protein n=1 Tax=Aaosphaeria arxii CBS 175.79 TaxID=1450172 RepID=A0A6A5X7J1_9PLEO|nr:uncharacterized protein BU24DRAFT_497519 [Aaosphaeria arxii CBS 175.79]KAF2008918.1 hypothetical protein BU24DRAFT_497519 [Aaosphaeria arxii CBS 175.79]
MAPVLRSRAFDGGRPNLDAVSIIYVALAIVYTIIVSAELFYLYRQRSAFCVRIRNIKVVFAAVSSLHIYLILVLLVYPLNGSWPCAAEFWVMSIFLPAGMALFQACNARVLKAYESQSRLQTNFLASARRKRFSCTPRGLYDAWLGLDAAAKVYFGSVLGLLITMIPALVLFLASRRFHGAYGIFGPIVDAVQCRKGGEWIPSILVQLFWTVIVGPWILWRIRKVNDVHYWAWQTRLAIVAGLPGTPLWLAFTYSRIPSMMAMNKYFVPAGWFMPSLIVCQQVLIVIPLREAFRTTSRRSSISSTTTAESLASTESSWSKRSPQIIISKELKPKASMQALEFSIEHSIEPLISWAASREFTAENTIFLREVRNFKKKWSELRTVTTAQRRQMFTEASLIFFTLINPFTAETPINIEYKIFRTLQRTFANVEYDPYMPGDPGTSPQSPTPRENVVCPWEDVLNRPTSYSSTNSASSSASTKSIVPSEFTDEIFDAAFESIKYLVFTNTWPRYVEAELAKDIVPSP